MATRLNGAAGVELKLIDKSGRPNKAGNKYRIGLVGWTPKGPSNQVTLIQKLPELYSMFGTPTGWPVDAVFALHNAKILLDAGAEVQLVRAVEGVSSATEKLNYYAHGTSAVSGLDNTSNNLSASASEGRYKLKPVDDEASPFTAFLKYPGFDGYNMTVQSFYHSIAEESSDGLENYAHTLNAVAGTDINNKMVEYKSYVNGLGLYSEYYEVVDGSTTLAYGDYFYPTTKKFYTLNGVDITTLYGASPAGTINGPLNEFISKFFIFRVYASTTDVTPVETIYGTIGEYVSASGQQLEIDSIDSNLLIFKENSAYTGTSIFASTTALTPHPLAGGSILLFGSKKPSNVTAVGTTNRKCFADAWKLFKDVSLVDVSLLVDGGASISGFGTDKENAGQENVDMACVSEMLRVSSYRMDAPSIIDVPKRASVDALVKLCKQYPSNGDENGGSSAGYSTFWGNLQDGRQIINDTFNRKQIECARSVFKAVAAFSVYTNSYPWQTQWGPNRGAISTPSIASLNPRKYPDEVGTLSKAKINPSRISANGEFFWDDYTLMAKNSVLNRWHAVCFLANLNRRYRTLLEQYVAELNTPALRKTIFTALNDDLDFIMNHADPAGLYNYYVICDETNNTPEVIDANELNVDIGLEIARDTRVINLTTTLYRTGGIIESGIKI